MVLTILCQWHANRNVFSKNRQVVGQVRVNDPPQWANKYENTPETDAFTDLYYAVLNAATEDEFESLRCSLQNNNQLLACYLDRHWWKYRSRLVR